MSLNCPFKNSTASILSVVSDTKGSFLGGNARSAPGTLLGSGVRNHSALADSSGAGTLNHVPPTVQRPSINPRAVYGLYCSWAIAGLMYGFVYNYINIPICQYVFGPMGKPGRSTVAQCNISQTITCLPWNFQVFYGLVLDRVGFFGTRRKGWILFGWTTSLGMLVVIAVLADQLVKDGALFTYMMLLLLMCVCYIFSTVSSDGMTIEFGKLEPPERRGYIMTTGQMVRFGSQVIVNVVGILGMNDKAYYPSDAPSNSTIFPFGLSFGSVHLVLLGMCVPLFIAMAFLLQDPPRDAEIHHSCGTVINTLWTVMKTRVMFSLIVFCVTSTAVSSLQNPALNIIANIAAPSTFQLSIGTLIGNILFLLGVWTFRAFFINRNWRLTFIWTALLLAANGCFQLMMIFNTWGVGQSGWFYALGSNVMLLIQGVQQVLSSLSVIEISPQGFEASVYEFLISVGNSGISLNANLMNVFVPIFSLNGIARTYQEAKEHDPAKHEYYNELLGTSTYFTMITNAVAALVFCWFLPVGKQQCHIWLAQWNKRRTAVFNLSFGWSVLFFSLTISMLSAIPSTSCLKIAGGDGCPS